MEYKTATIDECEVHYWIHNPKAKETIVAVHGFRGNHKALTDFADCFKNQRVILLDLPGHGQSGVMKCEHTLQNFAGFLDLFIKSLLNVDRFTLLGHSYGGSICIEYAALYPERLQQLILVSPAISIDGFWAAAGAMYYKASYLLPKKWQRAWLANSTIDRISAELLIKNVSKRRKQEMKAAGKRNLAELKPAVVIESSLSYFKSDLLEVARKIKMRTLIIAGALDQVVSLARIQSLHEKIPNSELVVIPDHGHLTPIEVPAQVARFALDFIRMRV